MNEWFYDIEPKILSRVQRGIPAEILERYPNIKFSTKNDNMNKPSYPFVYLHELSPSEMGRDLESNNINGSYYTIQIEISDNTKNVSGGENGKAICKRLMRNVLEVLKSMHFEITFMEFSDGDPDMGMARARRIIANDDSL